MPQASIEVNPLVCERLQPLTTTAPVIVSSVDAPQASLAEATPSAMDIAAGSGLQPRSSEPPLMINKGGVLSTNQFTVLDTVDVLPHASIALNVLVCVRLHPLLITDPSLNVSVGVLHASDAEAPSSAAVIEDDAGLQPRFTVA